MAQGTWMIYGANGYTGELAAREAVNRGMSPILAGRRRDAVEPLAQELNLECRIFDLDNANRAAEALAGVAAVLHCAGPFSKTSAPMLDACVKSGTHYLDITGEISVFEHVHQNNTRWSEAGIAAIPGVGFDVVPSDCLAALLKRELPDATHLELAFRPRHGKLSPGTTKTVIEGMPNGSMVRRNGKLVSEPSGSRTKEVPFPMGTSLTVGIPWGDVSTAYYSTGIPNIEVYMGTSEKQLKQLRTASRWGWVFKLPGVISFAQSMAGKKIQGPNETERANDETFLWGKVSNDQGTDVTMTLRTPESYTHTVHAALAAVERMLASPPRGGAYTPSMAFGAEFVLGLPGVELRHVAPAQ